MSIVYRAIDQLKPDPNNARRHSKKQIRQIAESIKAFGFNVPILIARVPRSMPFIVGTRYRKNLVSAGNGYDWLGSSAVPRRETSKSIPSVGAYVGTIRVCSYDTVCATILVEPPFDHAEPGTEFRPARCRYGYVRESVVQPHRS
jgi:hypothetical protein